jgi:aldose 1-epimerase
VLAPGRGAALLSLTAGGRDVLRPTPPDAEPDPRGPLETGCFPLVPYANRIAHGRFPFAGQDHRVPLNFGDHPHSLHGVGWTAPWTVEQADGESALLSHTHGGGAGWPWRYRAEQRLTLTPGGIVLDLSLTNLSDTAMPGGIGFHPYFALEAGMALRFAARGVWLSTPDLLPDRIAPAATLGDWGAEGGAAVAGDTLVDNCYAGWDGTARVTSPGGRVVTMTARGAPFLHVYRPPGEAFFCLEPVTHMPDALNRDGGMDVLAPGATMAITMEIGVA